MLLIGRRLRICSVSSIDCGVGGLDVVWDNVFVGSGGVLFR
jgi:hypothetical protein